MPLKKGAKKKKPPAPPPHRSWYDQPWAYSNEGLKDVDPQSRQDSFPHLGIWDENADLLEDRWIDQDPSEALTLQGAAIDVIAYPKLTQDCHPYIVSNGVVWFFKAATSITTTTGLLTWTPVSHSASMVIDIRHADKKDGGHHENHQVTPPTNFPMFERIPFFIH